MTVRNMLTSVNASLRAPSFGGTFNSYADSLTELHILCAIITNTNAAYYDYYELSTFRAASPCSGIASSVVQLAVQKAANISGKHTRTSAIVKSTDNLTKPGRFVEICADLVH